MVEKPAMRHERDRAGRPAATPDYVPRYLDERQVLEVRKLRRVILTIAIVIVTILATLVVAVTLF